MVGEGMHDRFKPPPSLSDAFSFARPEIIYIIAITMKKMHRVILLMKFQLQSFIVP